MNVTIKIPNRQDIIFPVDPEKTLMDILLESEIPIRSDCGGRGVCGKCSFTVEPTKKLSQLSSCEEICLPASDIEEGKRLACQTKIVDQGTINVTWLNTVTENSEISKTAVYHSFPVDSYVQRIVIKAESPVHGQLFSFNDISSWLFMCAQSEELDFSINALRQLSSISRLENEITMVKTEHQISSVLSGSHPISLGLAVDIGTTTLAVYLCDLTTGNIIASAAATNPQRIHGEDVISRIDFADKNPSNLQKLQSTVLTAIDALIVESVTKTDFQIDDIDDVCLVGNPTMQALLLGFCPKSLGRSPYCPVTRKAINIKNHELGLTFNKDVNCYIFPIASAFIGGDALAAAIAIEPPEPQERILIIDLGTNGELLLLTDYGSFATSAAMGPTFEGYTISCGVRAVPGAVNEMYWNGKNTKFDFNVIPGNHEKKIIGLCGSGLIDAVAAALKAKFINASGRIKKNEWEVNEEMNERNITLISAAECNTQRDLKLTQNDIRQLQLGKAALRVGIDSLFEIAGCTCVTKTIITGAFGANFNWQNAAAIGMIPPKSKLGKVKAISNAAGLGAIRATLNQKTRDRSEKLSQEIQCIALEKKNDFSEKFAEASYFSDVAE